MEITKLNDQETGVGRDSQKKAIWQESIKPVDTGDPALFNPDHVYDVLIAGAGITGLTTALLLQKSGRKCILAEAHTIGYGTTGGTTAHINTFLDTSYNYIEKDFGTEGAQLVALAAKEAIALVADLVGLYQINCGFEYKKGYVFSQNASESEELDKILEASQRAGVSVNRTDTIPANLPFEHAIAFDQQAQIDPLKYIRKLAKEFIKLGGTILQNTLVANTEKAGDYFIVQTSDMLNTGEQPGEPAPGKPIRAAQIIYATHIPPGINLLHMRCAPYRSYAVAVKLSDESRYPSGLLYDMKDPYHYIRSQEVNGEQYLIAGGEDHKTGHGNPDDSYKALEDYVRKNFPVASIDYRWSSQYYIPSDGLPYIGKLPGADEGIYTATGFSGNGITFGSIAGKILHDLVTGVENPYAQIFSPGRIKPVAGFKEFVKENADVAYRFIADRIAGADSTGISSMEAGTAAIINYNNEKLAVYKDPSGEVHALNPVCTHAKCIVNWNVAEKSWDCPCHGARYSIDGEVLTGPATRGLERFKL